MRRRARDAFLLTAAGAIGLACFPPQPTYPGERLDPGRVALLESGAHGRILEVDGKTYRSRDFELLPGEHRIRFKVVVRGEEVHPGAKGQRAAMLCEATFDASAGHAYRIERGDFRATSRTEDVSGWRREFFVPVRVIDIRSDQTVGRVESCHWK